MKLKIAMIPARMGSQRLKQKNLRHVGGLPLITRAIRKCLATHVFDEIWVNSEHPAFGEIAVQEGVHFHQRPVELADNTATSEQFVYEFLKAHPCDYLFQVHSIAPLLDRMVELIGNHFINEAANAVLDLDIYQDQVFALYHGAIEKAFEAIESAVAEAAQEIKDESPQDDDANDADEESPKPNGKDKSWLEV